MNSQTASPDKFFARRCQVLLACTWLAFGCSTQATRWQHDTYTVRSGDTLYAIAWHFGVDHRDLARWNGLGSGDVIYPGQALSLRPTSAAREPAAVQSASRQPQTKPSAPPTNVAASRRMPPPQWQWPARGKVVASFGDPRSVGKGIDIGGTAGTPVHAAASGRVVYAGSGLVGYGKLIIIKHSETYLSAYGHNARLLAAQGDAVVRGQQIAEMGLGPRRTAMLHFEIRVDGEAVDPIRFLPKR